MSVDHTVCGNCPDTGASCNAMSGNYRCTRNSDHDGVHVACGVNHHHLHEWPQDEILLTDVVSEPTDDDLDAEADAARDSAELADEVSRGGWPK